MGLWVKPRLTCIRSGYIAEEFLTRLAAWIITFQHGDFRPVFDVVPRMFGSQMRVFFIFALSYKFSNPLVQLFVRFFFFHLPHFFADAGCLKAFWRRCFAMRGRRLHKFREGKRIGKLRIFHSHSVSACCVQIKTADRTRKSLKRLRTQFHIAGSLSHLDLELPCCNLIVQKHKSSLPLAVHDGAKICQKS